MLNKKFINKSVGVVLFMAATKVLAQADLPQDLRILDDQFHAMVTNPSEQEEFQLRVSYLTVDAASSAIATEITLHESKLLQELDGLAIDEFKVSDLRHNHKHRDMLGPVLQELRLNLVDTVPYFCGAFKGADDKRELNSCMASVEELLRTVRSNDGRLVYMVSVAGEYWGPYKKVIVYVGSAVETNKYARFEFDVVHEI